MYKFLYSRSAHSRYVLFIGLYILICHLALGSLWIFALQSDLLRRPALASLIEYSLTSFMLLLTGAVLIDITHNEKL